VPRLGGSAFRQILEHASHRRAADIEAFLPWPLFDSAQAGLRFQTGQFAAAGREVGVFPAMLTG
jgi:hypothetical protein